MIFVIEAKQDDGTWWPLPRALYHYRVDADQAKRRKERLVTRELRVTCYTRLES